MRRTLLLSVLLPFTLMADATVKAVKAPNYTYEKSPVFLVEQGAVDIEAVGKIAAYADSVFLLEKSVLYHITPVVTKTGKFKAVVVSKYSFTSALGDIVYVDGKYVWISAHSKDGLNSQLIALCKMEIEAGGRNQVAVRVTALEVLGKPAGRIDLPAGEPKAVAYAEGTLYVLDTKTAKVIPVTPRAEKVSSIPAPSPEVADIAYDKVRGWFWAVVPKQKILCAFDRNGVVVVFKRLKYEPAGVATSGVSIWVVDASNKKLRKYRYKEEVAYQLEAWLEATVRFEVGGAPGCIALPWQLPHQTILNSGKIKVSQKVRVKKDNWGQYYVRFGGDGWVEVRAKIYRMTYNIVPKRCRGFGAIPRKVRRDYTKDGKMLKINSPEVQEAAKAAKALLKRWKATKGSGVKETPYWLARAAYEWLGRKIHYKRVPGWVDAPTILKRGFGTCSPISFAYVAVCRALGVPARFMAGTRWRRKDPSYDREFHRWCEVYIPPYGWVPVDPSAVGKAPTPLRAAVHWGHLPETDLVMTLGGGGSDVFGWAYNAAGRRAQALWSNIKKEESTR